MSQAVALSVDGVWKRFDREDLRRRTLKQAVVDPLRRGQRERFWALSDVNLHVYDRETVGLIGANGAGKSTLLRLAAGLGRPTRGRIHRRRRPEAILSLGDVFDPLLTGRENAVSAAIIAGATRREAQRKLEEIVAFAELEEFIDQPLRTYSDGMRLRLAFSVAVSAEPEILVIDEVLSVGDVRFQERCFARLAEFQERGAAILLASHDESQVRRMCNRVVWLVRGSVRADGDPETVFEAYREAMRTQTEQRLAELPAELRDRPPATGPAAQRFGTFEVEITEVALSPDEPTVRGVEGGVPLHVELALDARVPVEDPILALSVHRLADGGKVLEVSTEGDGVRLGRLSGRSRARLTLDHLDVEPGEYYLDVGVYERSWAYVYDFQWQAHRFRVRSTTPAGFGPARRWSVEAP